MPPRVAAVLFDLDETLLDRQGSLRRFTTAQHARHQDALGHILPDTYVEQFLALDENGRRWKDVVYQQIIEENRVVGLHWQTLLDEYIEQFCYHCFGFPSLEDTLKTLRAQERRLGLITNGPYPFQERSFQALGVQEYFEVVMVSEAEGIRKPEPEIFLRALARLEVTAQEAVFVGDNPEADIRGAQNVGMRTIWKHNHFWSECPFAHAQIATLDQVPALLAQWEKD